MTRGLDRRSSIAALIPHYRCEAWLADCLDSVTSQTRRLDTIVVIDDGSEAPPEEIVRRYPSVTLLRSPVNVGPYRLIQQVIDHTSFDGYMFQDADDWSGPRRLELLLEEAEASGAELIGCQEMRFTTGTLDVRPSYYAPGVRERALRFHRDYALLHASSVVSRDLVTRLGGFALGRRFGGDSEFFRRAIWGAHVTNIPYVCYFRRIRPGSLTTSTETDRDSAGRTQHREQLAQITKARVEAHGRNEELDLSPMSSSSAIDLEYVCGPALEEFSTCSSPRREDIQSSNPTSSPLAGRFPPLVVIGELAWAVALVHTALSQHPRFTPLALSPWLAGIPTKKGLRRFVKPRDIPEFNWVDGSTFYTEMVADLVRYFPSARFVLVRTGESPAQNNFDLDETKLHVLELGDEHVVSGKQRDAFVDFLGLAHGAASNDRMLRFLETGFV